MTHGIDRRPPRFVVMAGNFREFSLWAQSNKLTQGEALFVSSAQILRGRTFSPDTGFFIVGTFPERDDAQEIMETIRTKDPEVSFMNG